MTVIAIGFAGDRYYQQLYARNYPGYHVIAVLHGIQNGNTFDDLAGQFKSAEQLDEANSSVQKISQARVGLIQKGDEFWRFGDVSGRHFALFQFRNGLVVNHESSNYADPARLAAMNRFPIPPIILRFGFWQIYAKAIFIGVAMLAAVARVRSWRGKSASDRQFFG